jgi:hypothetical protein
MIDVGAPGKRSNAAYSSAGALACVLRVNKIHSSGALVIVFRVLRGSAAAREYFSQKLLWVNGLRNR